MDKVQVPVAAGRLISAVARIGYDPEVALCDLVDNSIDAEARKIDIHLMQEVREEEGAPDRIHRYVIVDDGTGMDNDTLVGAFTLGTPREYPPHSLGKFGLGLKSAGLSLGSQIIIITKKSTSTSPICAVLTMADVEESGKYEIELGDPPVEHLELWKEMALSQEHGTLVLLRQLTENQPPYTRFSEYLKRYCGVVHHMFMEKQENPVLINLNGEPIRPIDPLFMKEAQQNGSLENVEEWDGRTVHVLLEDTPLPLDSHVPCMIAATHLIHPPTFEMDSKRVEMRDHYLIEADTYTRRARHGFYVYRNRRVIVLAERFRGVVGAQVPAWAFRGRLMVDETSDKILSLDVKKIHCQLPTEVRSNLQSIIRNHTSKSVAAWNSARRRVIEIKRESGAQYADESIVSSPVGDLSYAPGADLANEEVFEKRKKLQQNVADETLRSIQDAGLTKEVLEAKAKEKSSVIFAQGLKANAMWLPYAAVQLGAAETVVNQAHTWVSEAYNAAEDDPRITLILHHLFTILARAELEVRATPWPDTSEGIIDTVLDRFRRKASAIAEDLAESFALELGKLQDKPTLDEEGL